MIFFSLSMNIIYNVAGNISKMLNSTLFWHGNYKEIQLLNEIHKSLNIESNILYNLCI